VGPLVYGGAALYRAEKAHDLLRFYREFIKKTPDELTLLAVLITAPPAPFVPAELQGKPMVGIAACYCGAPEKGDDVLKPVRLFSQPDISLFGPMPYVALESMFDASAPHGIQCYLKSDFLNTLDDGAIDVICDFAARKTSPHSEIHLHQLGGAVSRVSDGKTAFGQRDAQFALNWIAMWQDPNDSDRHIQWAREAWRAVQPYTSGGVYVNFLQDDDHRSRAAYTDRTYTRLADLKQKYDTKNMFCFNTSLVPEESMVSVQ